MALTQQDKQAVENASQKPTDSPSKDHSDPVSGDKGGQTKETGRSSGEPGGPSNPPTRGE
jgi:hypothetical protein